MKKHYLLCIFASILFSFNVYAQIWQPLGPNEANQATFSETGEISLALNSNGIPYLAFIDVNGAVSVRKFEGGSWTYVGTPRFTSDFVFYPCIAFDGNDIPYVAYRDGNNGHKATVKKLNGTNWETVGVAGISVGVASRLELVIDGNNTPYVLFLDDGNSNMTTVKKFDGSNWTDVGTPGFVTGYNAITISIGTDNIPYVAYPDPANARKITVKRFFNGNWETVGTAGFSTTNAENISIVIDRLHNNTPYVLYTENSIPVVKRYNGSNWTTVGAGGFSATNVRQAKMTVDISGNIYVVYTEGYDGAAVVNKFDGANWVQVETGSLSNGAPDILEIAIDLHGITYLAYRDANLNYKGVVKKFDGSNWASLGVQGFSLSGADDISLKMDQNNTAYVAYQDMSNYKATVKKYDGSTWVDVGTGLSPGEGSSPSIAFDANGTLYVVYGDGTNGNKATVQKFNGSTNTWETIGAAGFSGGNISYIKIAIDAANTPYVAYQDVSNNHRATVKKFDGTSWTTVGTAGFSAGTVFDIDIALGNDGVPYVAYVDVVNGTKITVKKFDAVNNNWVTVGTEGFSATRIRDDVSIAFDGNNVPYVTYVTISGNDAIPNVNKFNGNAWVNVGTVPTGGAEKLSLTFNTGNVPYLAYLDYDNDDKATVKKFNGADWINVGTPGFSAGAIDEISIGIGSNGQIIVVYSTGDVFAKSFIEGALPLHFLEFKGQLLNSDALLAWKTGNEENTLSFIVERSTDGRNYMSVGTVAAINTAGVHQYNFTDQDLNLPGASIVYYRLKQKDTDGNITYSRVIALPVHNKTDMVVSYRNPVYNEVNFSVAVNSPQQVQVRIIDNAGRVIRSQPTKLSAGSTSLSIDMSSLPKGLYYLHIRGNSISKQISIIKQ
jgi:hypothetical protein